MRLTHNPADKLPVRPVQRRLIEDVTKFERKLLAPLLPRPAEVLMPVDESGEVLSQDLAYVYADDTLNEVNMDGIEQAEASEPFMSKRLFIASVTMLVLVASAVTFIISFIDIRHVSDSFIRRLY